MNEVTTYKSIQVLNKNTNVNSIIKNIADSGNQEDAFYVFDINDIIRKHEAWKQLMPKVEPHYAVKCNHHPTVLKVLATLGIGFDCASKSEIDQVLDLGVDPSRIIYANTCKHPSHIRYAANVEVNLVTFDNELELHKLKQLHPSVKAVIRIKYDAEHTDIPLGSKFGSDPYTEAPSLLRLAHELGINVVGVSFHVGSGCREPLAYRGAIEVARHVFDFGTDLGYKFELLDIGGGFLGEHDVLDGFAKVINLALEEFFPREGVRFISEPGTYFVALSFTLACTVQSLRMVEDSTDLKRVYYVNDSIFSSFRCTMYDLKKVPDALKQSENCSKYSSIICGISGAKIDKIATDVLLPELQIGDWMTFPNMGAYTLVFDTGFASLESPNVYSVISHNNWLLLKDVSPLTEEDFSIITNGL